jgi:hypothetical protein
VESGAAVSSESAGKDHSRIMLIPQIRIRKIQIRNGRLFTDSSSTRSKPSHHPLHVARTTTDLWPLAVALAVPLEHSGVRFSARILHRVVLNWLVEQVICQISPSRTGAPGLPSSGNGCFNACIFGGDDERMRRIQNESVARHFTPAICAGSWDVSDEIPSAPNGYTVVIPLGCPLATRRNCGRAYSTALSRSVSMNRR